MTERMPKVALVTGAARRIGRALALDLARQGFAVAVHYREGAGAAEEVVAEIAAAGGRAIAFRADLAHESETAALVPRAREALGPLGLLVNNAARFERDEVEDATRESWDLHLEVNLRAPFVLSQAFARQLPEAAEGSIVNLLDQRVARLTPHYVSYTVSKTGLMTLTHTLALALAPRIRVNAIGPGPVLPGPRQTEERFARQWRATLLGRGTTLAEICAALSFILAAKSMTGQMISLDGGHRLGGPPAARQQPPSR
ncbi:MAG TPA: SDR family oxidoreductase [Alphaproteobacteria bacterium]|nr:SDR family oxidoreductase [Alphaproteobacteria bacterium]